MQNPTVALTGMLPAIVIVAAVLTAVMSASLLAFLNRRVRAVGPMLLAFMLAGVTGAFLFIDLAGRSQVFLGMIPWFDGPIDG